MRILRTIAATLVAASVLGACSADAALAPAEPTPPTASSTRRPGPALSTTGAAQAQHGVSTGTTDDAPPPDRPPAVKITLEGYMVSSGYQSTTPPASGEPDEPNTY